MARYEFYEVRSSRTQAAGDADRTRLGIPALTRTSFSCAQRGDLVLFLWRSEGDEVEAWQLLFGERFIEWSARGPAPGLFVGVTDRAARSPAFVPADGARRMRGVRTLQRTDEGEGEAAAVLAAARELLADAVFPAAVDGMIRATLRTALRTTQ